MNSTADSATKLRATIAEAMTLDSSRKATANWERAQRMAYGDHHRESDFAGEEMILVDSTLTINHAPPVLPSRADDQASTSPESSGSPKASRRSSPVGTLAKLAVGAALVASGAGMGIGLPLLLSGGKGVVDQVVNKPAETSSAGVPGKGVEYILELGKE